MYILQNNFIFIKSITIMLLLLLQIVRRQLVKFLVLVLWIDKRMWCMLQNLTFVDLDP
jgi:hypothetical protein